MPNVRRDVLRRFYANKMGSKLSPEEVVDGATFDEYYELQRIDYPDISRKTAAANAPLERFRTLAEKLEDEPPRKRVHLENRELSRLPEVDLASARIDPKAESLVISKVKRVTGWSTLRRLDKLRELWVLYCSGPAEPATSERVQLSSLRVEDCDTPCLSAVLGATSAQAIRLVHRALPSLDLRRMDLPKGLVELSVGGAIALGVSRLAGMPLEELGFGNVVLDEEFRRLLTSLARTLRVLRLASDTPFSPDAMPDLDGFQKLERAGITVHEQYKEAWIDFAMNHPKIAFDLRRHQPSEEDATLVEIYKGIDVLRVRRKKRIFFEISGDFAEEFGATDNEEFEDRMKPLAKAAKRKVTWSSELDTFVAQAPDIESCRWLIDALHDSAKSEKKKRSGLRGGRGLRNLAFVVGEIRK